MEPRWPEHAGTARQGIAFLARPLAFLATFLHTGRPCASRMSFMPVTPSRRAKALPCLVGKARAGFLPSAGAPR